MHALSTYSKNVQTYREFTRSRELKSGFSLSGKSTELFYLIVSLLDSKNKVKSSRSYPTRFKKYFSFYDTVAHLGVGSRRIDKLLW